MAPKPTPTDMTDDARVKVHDDVTGTEIDVSVRAIRSPGRTNRKRRVDSARIQLAHALGKKDPKLSKTRIQELVEAKLAEWRARDIASAVDTHAQAVAPTSTTRSRSKVNLDVEVAAINRLPQMIWLRETLAGYVAGPKSGAQKALRHLVVSVGLHMGMAHGRPQIRYWREKFLQANPVLSWAHLYPDEGPGEKSFYKAVKGTFSERHDVLMCEQINRDLFMELVGDYVVDDVASGAGHFSKHPNALRHLLVDATLVEAHLEQRAPVNEDEARLMRGDDRARSGFVVYKLNGQVRKKCHGYKWVTICDLATGGLPLVCGLFAANANERECLRHLLIRLYEKFPEVKAMKDVYLTGDALYDQDEHLAYELVFRWGIHPVFPEAGAVSRKYEWASTKGVPVCSCGEPAKYVEAADFPTPAYRRRRGLPDAGEYISDRQGQIIDNARIRWACADGKSGCRVSDTYPRENARLYTYLPRTGSHKRAALREALLLYRNPVESLYAALENMGLAGEGQERPRWAGDEQMEWLLWLGTLSLTARRLVHQNGLYAATHAEAEADELLTQATALHPAPGPTDRTAAQVHTIRKAWWSAAKAPHGWQELPPFEQGPYA